MATAQCSWRACTTRTPGIFAIATPVHVGVAHQREQHVHALGGKGAGQHVGHLQLAHLGVSLFPNRLRSHDRNARHMRLPAFSSAAGGDGGVARRRVAVAGVWPQAPRRPTFGHQPGKIGREFAEQGARDMHAAGIGEGFQRPGDAEAAVDGELGRLLARDLDDCPRRARARRRVRRCRGPRWCRCAPLWSKARLASPRNTATVGPNFTRTEPRHSPSPWSGDSVAPGMHEATSAGSLSSGQTSSAGSAIVVVSLNATMVMRRAAAGSRPA